MEVYSNARLRPVASDISNTRKRDWRSRADSKQLLLLLLICSGISPNPGPLITWDDIPIATAIRPMFSSVNLCGLQSKIEDVRLCLSLHRFQVLAVQESHLNPRIDHNELNVPGYQLFRKDRSGAAKGGVALYIADSLHPSKLTCR